MPTLSDRQISGRYDEAAAAAVRAGRLAQREGELDVGVAVVAGLRVRPAGGQRGRAARREQVAEDRVDVAGGGLADGAPFVVDVDEDAAPTRADDVVVRL